MSPSRKSTPRWSAIEVGVVAGAALLSLGHSTRVFRSLLSDDAFIVFRYASNLVNEGQLVWNPGAAPIEGFTSLLHVLLIAGGIALGWDPLWVSQIIGIAGAMVGCVAAAALARRMTNGSPVASAAAAVLTSLSLPLAFWARGGLETTLFTALLASSMAIWLADRERGAGRARSSIAFFVATLARPEALGIWLITLVTDAIERRRGGARSLIAWWPYPALLLLLLGWKIAYFGSVLPTVYHAKSGGGWMAISAGLLYTYRFLQSYGALGLVLASIPFLLPFRESSRERLYVATCSVIYMAWIVKVGGDYQGAYRYLVPVVPLLAASTASGVEACRRLAAALPGWRARAIPLLLFAVTCWTLAIGSLRELREEPSRLTRPWRLVEHDLVESSEFVMIGRALREKLPAGSTVGAMAIGAIGYYSQLPILDLFGLTDRELATASLELDRYDAWQPGHMKGDAEIILRKDPDCLILMIRSMESAGDPPPMAHRRKFPFVDDLLRSDDFVARYEADPLQLPNGRWLTLYRRLRE